MEGYQQGAVFPALAALPQPHPVLSPAAGWCAAPGCARFLT